MSAYRDPAKTGPNEILPNFYLGPHGSTFKKATLQRLNIKYILNMAGNSCKNKHPTSLFTYKTYYLADTKKQDIEMKVFQDTYRFIDNALNQGCGVAVHCMAGVSRSTTIVIAYLMRKNRSIEVPVISLIWPLTKAYRFVKAKRTQAQPNEGFVRQLLELEASIFSSSPSSSPGEVKELVPPPERQAKTPEGPEQGVGEITAVDRSVILVIPAGQTDPSGKKHFRQGYYLSTRAEVALSKSKPKSKKSTRA